MELPKTPSFRLDGKTALITGASSGIGRAAAVALAEAGAQIGASVEDVVVEEIDVDFDLAEPGALMDTREKQPPAPAPDTSHLQINDEDH